MHAACSVCSRLNEIHCSMFIACGVIIIVGTFFGAIHVFTLILCLTRFQFFYLLHPVWIPLAFLLNRSLTISVIRDRMLVLFSVIQSHDEDKVRFHSQLHELQNNQSALKKSQHTNTAAATTTTKFIGRMHVFFLKWSISSRFVEYDTYTGFLGTLR